MSKKVKKVLFLIAILIICVCVIIVIKKMINKQEEAIAFYGEGRPEGWGNYNPTKIKRVGLRSDYILVERCIKKYIKKCSNNENTQNLIAEEYLNLYNLSTKNDNENNIQGDELEIDNMYVVQIGEDVKIYFVDGYVINSNTQGNNSFKIGVVIDRSNNTFGVITEKYLEKIGYSNVDENTEIDLKQINQIKNKKDENTFEYQFINEKQYILDYLFPDFLDKCLSNPEKAYECLDDEYKEKKFGSIDRFKEYLEAKRTIYESYNMKNAKTCDDFKDMYDYLIYLNNLNTLDISSYEMKNKGEYIQYVLIDSVGNYYIFRETGTLKYTAILDTYTVELPEFTKKYNEGDAKTKTVLNIEKIASALNDKDYEYVYDKLADSFKQNYFPTLESFAEYALKTFGINNEVKYINFVETSNYCTYEITFKNDSSSIRKTIIMQLQDDESFVMSFNVE